MMPSRLAALVAPLAVLLSGALAACPSAAPKPDGTHVGDLPKDPDASWFVGVFTTSTESYEAAAAATEAVSFAADGSFVRGEWHAAERRFTPIDEHHVSPGFVNRWALQTSQRVMSFMLDGAEEYVPYVVDGPDRWKTVYVGRNDQVEVHYVRQVP